MENKIQELTEKIYAEGVEKGNVEAARIVEEAKEKASDIVSKAKAEAEAIVAAAEKKATELEEQRRRLPSLRSTAAQRSSSTVHRP